MSGPQVVNVSREVTKAVAGGAEVVMVPFWENAHVVDSENNGYRVSIRPRTVVRLVASGDPKVEATRYVERVGIVYPKGVKHVGNNVRGIRLWLKEVR